MKVQLIAPSPKRTGVSDGRPSAKGVFTPLGLMQVAGIMPATADVSITDEVVEPTDFACGADVVGLTMMTAAAPRAYEIADRFRAQGTAVVMGGMHASALPDEALQHADAVVVGEAEGAWTRALADFERGKMAGVYRNDTFPTLDNLPLPRRDLIDSRRYLGPNTIQATRGCPYACSFCTVSTFFGRSYRTRSIDEVIDEAAGLRGKPLMFVDDNIMGQPSYAQQLFERLKDLKLTFFGQASTSMLKTPDLIKKAAEAGCKGLFVGLESLSAHNLASVGKKINVVDTYRELISRLHDHGIAIVGSFIFGLDGDDEDVFERTADFAEEAKIDVPQFSILTPLPGTRLYAQVESEGRIIERNWAKYDFKHVCFRPRHMTADRLESGIRWVNKRLYSWRSIIKRTASRLQPLVWKVNAIYRHRLA